MRPDVNQVWKRCIIFLHCPFNLLILENLSSLHAEYLLLLLALTTLAEYPPLDSHNLYSSRFLTQYIFQVYIFSLLDDGSKDVCKRCSEGCP